VLISSLDGMQDPNDNIYKSSNKSVVLIDNSLIQLFHNKKSIVIKAHLQTSSLLADDPIAIPSNAFLYFESFLKLTTKNVIP
jgi:hypothetical protein